jgi:PAS domain S-box-containing protein
MTGSAVAAALAGAVRAASSRVLVVDDDPDILLILRLAFESAGHGVATASGYPAFLQSLATGAFDAVVLDVMMPERSGWEILSDLRRDARTASLPVMMLSSAGDTVNRVKGLRLGADDFLAKPFDAEEVVVRVEGLIARRAAASRNLEGSLAALSASDLAQTIRQNRQSGRLELQGTESSGWLEFSDGLLVGARLGNLAPEEAAIDQLRWSRGRFHFATAARPKSVDGSLGPALRSVEELLLEAAWIEDELAARRRFLPADDEPLAADPDRRLESPADLPSLPVNAVLATVRQRNGVCLADLLSSELAAPGRTRLAVAALVEVGGLRRQSGEQEAPRAANQPAAERRGGRIAEAIGTASWSGADDFRVVDEEVAFPEGRLIVSRSDPAGKITYVNDAFCEISGYDRAEVLGKPHSILRHPDMPNALFRGLWETLGRREIWHGYVKNRCKDGRYYWVYATIIPNQRGGRVVGYTSVRREPSRARVEEIEAEYRASSSRRVEG